MAAPKGNCFNPKGRPCKEIDWKLFEDLCYHQCTQEEIANILHINRETLTIKIKENYNEDFPAVYKRFSAGGKLSVRRTQFRMAQKNATMAIWLGKQYLDQKDTPTEMHANEEMMKYYEQMIEQLRNLQSSKSSLSISTPPETASNDSNSIASSSV